jgi:hypothetical protein
VLLSGLWTEVPAPSKSGNASGTAARNVESILRIEKEDKERLLLHHRVFHAVGRFIGTPYFLIIQSLGRGVMGMDQHHRGAGLEVR